MPDDKAALKSGTFILRPPAKQTPDGEWALRAEIDLYVKESLIECLAQPEFRGELVRRRLMCGTGCGSHGDHVCNEDTRLSAQRKINLRRQRGHLFGFDTPAGQFPVLPGETKTWRVPPYPIGRVIEKLYLRLTMSNVNNVPAENWDHVWVTIAGEDGVPWTSFAGGRHMTTGNPCCLLEAFRDDCIGYMEGFLVTLSHKGPNGSPSVVMAAMDWEYIFPGMTSALSPGWCWPGSVQILAKI